jgi:UDPglucose--hexose-1-phosphate uridylyltransferase
MRNEARLTQAHRRFDPLADRWVLVSANRKSRPWLGRREQQPIENPPEFDPGCYLCPGNVRASGERNPKYDSTYVFTNDFAALTPDAPLEVVDEGLLQARGERGTSLVLCYSPRHDRALSTMATAEVRKVVELWASLSTSLGGQYRWVQLFENRGSAMGASSRHPHGQAWASLTVPSIAAREDSAQRTHYERTKSSLLIDYAAQEADGPRVVDVDDEWITVVPFWAAWPYETLLLPRRPVLQLPDLDERQRASLTDRLGVLLRAYDRLFGVPFPYSMGWHQAPFDDADNRQWQLHCHFYPPLLGPDQAKFMVGYELLSETQRDITPEDAADDLRRAITNSK